MPDRPKPEGPDLAHVREALREHDEVNESPEPGPRRRDRAAEEARREDDD